MKRIRNITLATLVLGILSTAADAQYRPSSRIRPPIRQPTTSPYLNLLRGPGGGGMGFNYYQRVRPQLDYLETTQTLGRSVQQLQRQQSAMERQLQTGLPGTGHSTSFLNYGGYYPQLSQ